MVSISIVKRIRKRADGTKTESETWFAQIRFTKPIRASYLRDTGTSNERKAEKIAHQIAKTIETQEIPERVKPRVTVEGMFSAWIAEHGKDLRSGKDLSWQIRLLIDLMGSRTPIAEIGNAAVHEFTLKAREAGKSDVVINRCLTRLRATLRYAGKKWEATTQAERIDWASHFSAEPGEKEMYLSPDEARRAMAALPPHIALAFAFSYYTGARLNEVETLTWERVDLAGKVAVVETKGTGKGLKFRQLRLSENALKVLKSAHDAFAPNVLIDGLVFDFTNRRRAWERARKAIGRPDVTWHGIRHTTATEAGKRTQSDKTIGKLLGHTPGSRATQRYLHVMDGAIFEALEGLPDIGLPGKGEWE